LLANAVGQTTWLCLIQRVRQQAGSYREIAFARQHRCMSKTAFAGKRAPTPAAEASMQGYPEAPR
jgi:hypothetical protein